MHAENQHSHKDLRPLYKTLGIAGILCYIGGWAAGLIIPILYNILILLGNGCFFASIGVALIAHRRRRAQDEGSYRF